MAAAITAIGMSRDVNRVRRARQRINRIIYSGLRVQDAGQVSFDAVLIVAFGGPQGTADVRPFLANVLRGRRVAPERVEEVVHHYELFHGVSPLTELTMRQADILRARLHDRGVRLPVYVGMRNWHPFLADTLAEMSRAGVRRAGHRRVRDSGRASHRCASRSARHPEQSAP